MSRVSKEGVIARTELHLQAQVLGGLIPRNMQSVLVSWDMAAHWRRSGGQQDYQGPHLACWVERIEFHLAASEE